MERDTLQESLHFLPGERRCVLEVCVRLEIIVIPFWKCFWPIKRRAWLTKSPPFIAYEHMIFPLTEE